MKLSSFEKIIRKVVREEIDYALRREIALLKEELTPQPQQRVVESQSNPQEVEDFRSKLRAQMPPPNFLLSETAVSPTPEQTMAANDPVNQFLNKDYSQLMNAIEKKKEFRP